MKKRLANIFFFVRGRFITVEVVIHYAFVHGLDTLEKFLRIYP